jgi:hypothetical protein
VLATVPKAVWERRSCGALLAQTGMRLGEVLGMRIRGFVMGRGSTPCIVSPFG